jgi:hypothetical protein
MLKPRAHLSNYRNSDPSRPSEPGRASQPGPRARHVVCTPLHTGRNTIILETDITRSDGKLATMVIQTQIVLPVEPRPE